MENSVEPKDIEIEPYTSDVLFVDDEVPILNSMKRLVRTQPWNAHFCESGDDALAFMENQKIDVVISDMRMPGMDGAEFLTLAREKYPGTERILLTGYSDIGALERAINGAMIYNYLTKPWDDAILIRVINGALSLQSSERERKHLVDLTKKQNRDLGKLALSLNQKVKERTIEIQQALTLLQMEKDKAQRQAFDGLSMMTDLIERSRGGKGGRGRAIADHGRELALALGLSDREVENTRLACLMHDAGLLVLPEDLRASPLYLMPVKEIREFQTYPELSQTILGSSPELLDVSRIVGACREYMDGSGYPQKLKGKDISLSSRIVCVAVDYHNLKSGLLIKGIGDHEGAMDYLSAQSGIKYDTDVISEFSKQLEDYVDVDHCASLKSTYQLQPGMILAADVITPYGVLLLKSGAEISPKAIEKFILYERDLGMPLKINIQV